MTLTAAGADDARLHCRDFGNGPANQLAALGEHSSDNSARSFIGEGQRTPIYRGYGRPQAL